MNNVKSKVALVRCFSYQQEEVEQALAKGLALLGGFSNIFSAKQCADFECQSSAHCFVHFWKLYEESYHAIAK